MRRCLPACIDFGRRGIGRQNAAKLVRREVYMRADLCGGRRAVEQIEDQLQQAMRIFQHPLPVGQSFFHLAPHSFTDGTYRANW